MENGAGGRKQFFSWDDLPEDLSPDKRYALWRDTYTSRYGSADFAPHEDRPFFANSEFMLIGGIGISRFSCSMRYFKRTAAHVAADARDDLLIGFNQGDAIRCRMGRSELDMPSSGAVVYTSADPLDNRFEGWTKITGLSLPRAQLAALIDHPEDLTGALKSESAAVRHLRRYVDFLLTDDTLGDEPALIARVETMLLDLIALALGARGDAAHLAQSRGLRAARLRDVLQEIKNGYARPDFSPAAVARKFGLSPRYIQDLLQETGTTFIERVLAAAEGALDADGPQESPAQDQRDRAKLRVRRRVLFQPGVPPPFRRVADAGAGWEVT